MASTASKPASLAAWNFSMTFLPTPMVPYMMPFLMARFLGASEAKVCPLKARAAAAAAVVKNRGAFASRKFGLAGHGDWRNGKLLIPVREIGRGEAFLGIEGVIPANDLAGVSGHAAHDGEHGALGHAIAVVDGFAFADGGEEFVVLDLIHVGTFALEAPLLLADDVEGAEGL